MWLTRVSINNPYFAAVLMFLITVMGLFAWKKLPLEELPDVSFPIAVVSTAYIGASPQSVETEVTRPLEESINTISGIKNLRSYSLEGISTIVVEFELSVDERVALQDVRDRVSAAQADFKDEVSTPSVSTRNPDDEPILSFAFTAPELSPRELTNWVNNTVKKRLQMLEGVGEVLVYGGVTREVRVDLQAEALKSLGLSTQTIAQKIKTANQDYPAGQLTINEKDYALRVVGKLATIKELGDVIVATRNTRPITLKEVATLSDSQSDAKTVALLNGKTAVGVEIRAIRGGNIVKTVENLKTNLNKMQADFPKSVTYEITLDRGEKVERSVQNVQNTLIEGAVLTVLIVFLFLGSWRSTVITGLTLPISIIGTFFALEYMGFTLNVMTLMALSLSVGLLIDDAIVVRENIVRHKAMGKTHYQAALDGTNEIGLAVTATTLTIVAVFLPVGMMPGIIGQFFHQFGLAVVVAVLISLAVSFSLDPMLSSIWHDPHQHGDKHKGPFGPILDWFETSLDRLANHYVFLIKWALLHRLWVIGITTLVTVASFSLPVLGLVGGEFIPAADTGKIQVRLETSDGASLAYTEAQAQRVAASLHDLPHLISTQISVGSGSRGSKNKATLLLNVGKADTRAMHINPLMAEVRKRVMTVPSVSIKGISIADQGGPSAGKPISVSLRGNDLAALTSASNLLLDKISQIEGVRDMESSLTATTPSFDIKINREAAMNLGVDLSILGSSIETLLSGQNVGLWEASDGESYDIRVQIPKSERTLNTLNQLTIPGKSDDNGVAAMIPLSNIASITPSSSPRQINRTNLLRDISLTGNIEGRNKAAVFKDIQALLQATTLPEGIIKVQEGDNQNMKESGDYALQALMLGVLLIYFILTAQFRSFTLPITIMMALPLSFVGVFAGLAIGGSTLNMFSVIGIIMLMGLATKNGILLVDYINQCRSEGLSRYDAIIEGGRVRLRPILMTSLAMIIGMLPMAFATGDGSETQRPMAQAIIGGLITSTLLTLVVVPVIYTYMDSFRMLLHRLIGSGKYTPTADTQSQ